MARKHRTVPQPPSRKCKASARPVPPRPKGEEERIAVRRLAAMKYRLAGATYRVIAEKLTEDRAQAYADANDTSIVRAMKKIQPVSLKTAWEDVMAEMEELRRETEVHRGDLMALENARLDQLFAKALSLYGKGREPVSRYAAHASYAGSLSGVRLSQGRWVSVIRRALLLVNHDLQKPRSESASQGPITTSYRTRVRRSLPFPSTGRPRLLPTSFAKHPCSGRGTSQVSRLPYISQIVPAAPLAPETVRRRDRKVRPLYVEPADAGDY